MIKRRARDRFTPNPRDDGSASPSAPRETKQGQHHPFDLALAHLGVEGQRQGSLRDLLTDREFPGAMRKSLAVKAHQVDRREVGLALDAARGETLDHAVAVDAARQLHDEDEPATIVSLYVRARRLQSIDPCERFPISGGNTRAFAQ